MDNTITIRGKTYRVNVPSAYNPFGLAGNRIVGIEPPADASLLQEFKDAWTSKITSRSVKTWKVWSASKLNKQYTVRCVDGVYYCDCPSYRECWHIRKCKGE